MFVSLHFSTWHFWFRQLNGNMAVVLYLTEIFDKANTGIDPGLQATLVSLVQVIERKRLAHLKYIVGPCQR